VQDRFGPPDVLEIRDVPRPEPGPGEVLVRVRAASVNPADWHLMRGRPYIARLDAGSMGRRRPASAIRGRDLAGHVEAVGTGVQDLRPGDEVYGESDRNGAFAEYVAVSAGTIARKPANLTFAQAAAVPLAANTALQALRDEARVQPGQRVAINGASGGVGTFAVQIARILGAEVTAVCSARNHDLVRRLGAAHVVDYTTEDIAAGPERYDVLLSLGGTRGPRDLRRALTPEGTLVLCSGEGGRVAGPMLQLAGAMAMSRFVPQTLRAFLAKSSTANLDVLRRFIEDGELQPVIDRTYALSDVPEAIRYVEAAHTRGKVVVTV
jgi:NADPH:quinone reductase-like Zn-dependent oxidoreductase